MMRPSRPVGLVGLVRLVRLFFTMIRPPASGILLLFAALGSAQAGVVESLHPLFTTTLVIVAAWFVTSACLNDIADEKIDRVNLAGVRNRPLVAGSATPEQLMVVAAAGALISLATAWSVNWRVGVVATAGLLLSVAYSVPPIRLSDRGGLAIALLPTGYVALPYLVGALSVAPKLDRSGMILLAGLYLSFLGRIVLKDFRDVEGDARFGKRTFLVRHGQRVTCLLSSICWTAGAGTIFALEPLSSPVLPAILVCLGCVYRYVWQLAAATEKVEQISVIAGAATVGRGMALLLIAHYTMLARGWEWLPEAAMISGLIALIVVTAVSATDRSRVLAVR
jgi:4-hydroxybenzoate polyprenyltransferase